MTKKLCKVFLLLSIIWTLFIWSNSLKNAIVSTGDSNIVVTKVEQVFEKGNINMFRNNLTNAVRKSAHFVEFAVQAILICITYLLLKTNVKDFAIKALFFGLLTAVIDEYIQLFADGRGSQVVDIVTDFAGYITGFILVILIYMAIYKKTHIRGAN